MTEAIAAAPVGTPDTVTPDQSLGCSLTLDKASVPFLNTPPHTGLPEPVF